MEKTLALIKPDATAGRNAGAIIQRIEKAGFTIRAMKMMHLSQAQAEGFYAVHRQRPFFGSLTEYWMEGDWSGIPRIKNTIKRKPEDNMGI